MELPQSPPFFKRQNEMDIGNSSKRQKMSDEMFLQEIGKLEKESQNAFLLAVEKLEESFNQRGCGVPPATSLEPNENKELLLEVSKQQLRDRFCVVCKIRFASVAALQSHYLAVHPELYEFHDFSDVNPSLGCMELTFKQEAMNGLYKEYEIDLTTLGVFDLMGLFDSLKDSIVSIIKEELGRRNQLKVPFMPHLIYSREDHQTGETIYHTEQPQSFLFGIEQENMIPFAILHAKNQLQEGIDTFTNLGSGWTLECIEKFEMLLCKYDAFTGGSSLWTTDKFHPLLKFKRDCYINTVGENDSEHCFAHAVMCKFEWSKTRQEAANELRVWNEANPEPRFTGGDLSTHKALHKTWLQDRAKKTSAVISKNKNFRHRKLQSGKFMDKKLKTIISNGETKLKYKCNFACGKAVKEVDFSDLKWPFSLDQIKRFEKNNPLIGLTVIGFDDEESYKKRCKKEVRDEKRKAGSFIDSEVDESQDCYDDDDGKPLNRDKKQKLIREKLFPLYTCKEKRSIMIDLLLVMREGTNHFVFIEKLNTLVETEHKDQHDICRYCLQFFNGNSYKTHVDHCTALGCQKTNFPKDSTLKFKAYHRTQTMPYIYVADFEAILPKCEVLPDEQKVGTIKTNKHVACGYSWTCLDHNNKAVKTKVFRLDPENPEHQNIDVAKQFVKELLEDGKQRQEQVLDYERAAKQALKSLPPITAEQQASKVCWFCKQDLLEPVNGKLSSTVRHHTHLPPYNAVGLAHSICNLSGSLRTTFPCFIHNLTGYDSKFIIQCLDDEIVESSNLIAISSEKFKAININKTINFVDSLGFFNESLEKLVDQMNKKTDFGVTRSVFKSQWLSNPETAHWGDEHIDLLLRKGAYPYKYMDSFERFKEKRLPDIEKFFNDLSEEPLEPKVYENAQKVWTDFKIKNMGEWHDLYVKTDVTLLADAIVNLRKVMFQHYELDIAHYLSLPMFSLDAALKYTGARLELITDPDMFMWVERAIRGGLTTVGDLRAAQANNKYLSTYDSNRTSSYILYVDANNLYGSGLSDLLPTDQFKWANPSELRKIRQNPKQFVENMDDKANTGMYFEVDLIIDRKHHEHLNAFPPCPNRRSVSESEVSPHTSNLGGRLGVGPTAWKTEKLITDLNPKKNYICHYRALKLWLQLGVEITCVHKVLSFRQTAWMEPYISFNTEQRKKASFAKNDIEVKFWKNLNNTGYGKTIENKRDRHNIILITSEKKAKLYNKKPTIQNIKILNPNLVLAVCKRLQVTLDRPIAVGVAVLELAKVVMYKFHYNYIVPKYTDPVTGRKKYYCLYSDTDSEIYLLETDDVYKDCQENAKDYFDMSDYDPKHPIFGEFFNPENAKRLAMMKDECANKVPAFFIACKPKMYVLRYEHYEKDKITGEYLVDPATSRYLIKTSDTKKAKEIGITAVRRRLTFEDYLNAVSTEYQSLAYFTRIASKNNQLFTTIQFKRAVNGFDNKRFFIDEMNSLALGHCNISNFV